MAWSPDEDVVAMGVIASCKRNHFSENLNASVAFRGKVAEKDVHITTWGCGILGGSTGAVRRQHLSSPRLGDHIMILPRENPFYGYNSGELAICN